MVSYKKINSPQGEISCRDQNRILNQAVNMFSSAVNWAILTWGFMMDWL